MFLKDVFLENATNELYQMVEQTTLHPIDPNFRWDNYIAMSLMQKSIRRSSINDALLAGMFLLKFNHKSFWKRLCVCAVEDVGVANLKLVAQILIVANDRHLRRELGEPEQVARAMLTALCASPKDRCTDDLIDAIENVSQYSEFKADIAEHSETDLEQLIASKSVSIQHRAIAAIQLATGWDDFSTGLRA